MLNIQGLGSPHRLRPASAQTRFGRACPSGSGSKQPSGARARLPAANADKPCTGPMRQAADSRHESPTGSEPPRPGGDVDAAGDGMQAAGSSGPSSKLDASSAPLLSLILPFLPAHADVVPDLADALHTLTSSLATLPVYAWSAYLYHLQDNPFVTKLITAFIGCIIGDLIAQVMSHMLATWKHHGESVGGTAEAGAADVGHEEDTGSHGESVQGAAAGRVLLTRGGGSDWDWQQQQQRYRGAGAAAAAAVHPTAPVSGANPLSGFRYNVGQAARLLLFCGLTAPIGQAWFAILDSNVFPTNPTAATAVMAKVALDQLCMAPVMTFIFFATMKVMEDVAALHAGPHADHAAPYAAHAGPHAEHAGQYAEHAAQAAAAHAPPEHGAQAAAGGQEAVQPHAGLGGGGLRRGRGIKSTAVALLRRAQAAAASKWAPTLRANWVVWPLAHVVNFALVPSDQRILYVTAVSVVWTAFLSWQASHMAAGAEPAVAGHDSERGGQGGLP